MPSVFESEPIARLYHALLDAWNRRDARAYASLFTNDASVVGFDGSLMNGQPDIETTLSAIFADHMTAAYVGKVRFVRSLAPNAALLEAVCGMIPAGQADLNPAVNAIQSMVAVQQPAAGPPQPAAVPSQRTEGQPFPETETVLLQGWRIAHFQNTPAQFHGRPELSAALTDELRALLPH